MHFSNRRKTLVWSSLFFLLAIIISPALNAGTVVTVPPDLNPGDEYRLVFISSAARNGTSPFIEPYNTHVTNAANLSPDLVALGTNWKAIVSTAGSSFVAPVAARDNTNTDPTPAGTTGVPIYRLDGTRVADNYDDLWDGTLGAIINTHESGDYYSSSVNRAWTGTGANGLGAIYLGNAALGTDNASESSVYGRVNDTGRWIFVGTKTYMSRSYPLYGMSDVLTVPVPEPCSGTFLGMAIFGLLAVIRKRKK